MTILLAPMEGLLDFTLRDILTRAGGADRCVAEFIRVTGTLLPERVFTRVVPELNFGSRTRAGVSVRVQLMGSDPVCLAENAARLAGLHPAGIDLNFGCPAKIVNRHGGGAALLQDPALLHRIVGAVRRAVPASTPVTAKMRLGFNDADRALECAQAIVSAGAGELVVHARTKADGYRPPAYWERIAEIREAVAVPVIANGEIWNVADALRCRELSGCETLMLGRGMVADPGLALAIVAADRGARAGLTWAELQPLLAAFWQLVGGHVEPKARAGRLKQWLNYLRRRHPQAEVAYMAVRTINDPRDVADALGLAPAVHVERRHHEEPNELEVPRMKTWNIEIQKVKAMANGNGLIRMQLDALVQAAPAHSDEGMPSSILTLSEANARTLMLLLKAQIAELDSRKAKSRR